VDIAGDEEKLVGPMSRYELSLNGIPGDISMYPSALSCGPGVLDPLGLISIYPSGAVSLVGLTRMSLEEDGEVMEK